MEINFVAKNRKKNNFNFVIDNSLNENDSALEFALKNVEEINGNKFCRKNLKFYCEKCGITTNNKYDYNKHILTSKHTKIINGNEMSQNQLKISQDDYASIMSYYLCVLRLFDLRLFDLRFFVLRFFVLRFFDLPPLKLLLLKSKLLTSTLLSS